MGDVRRTNPVNAQWYYLDYLQLGVMVIDEQYRIVYWNRWLENHSNILSETVENQLFKTVFPDLEDSRLFELIQQVIEEQLSGMMSAALNRSLLPLYPSINHQLKQMDVMKQMVQVTSMEDSVGRQLAMVQITDMTRAEIRNAQIRKQSQAIKALESADEITGLPNRQQFDISMHQEFRRILRARASLVVAIVEIDHFQNYISQYGSASAHKCVMKVADIFGSLLCRQTDMVARYSPAAFGLILPFTTQEGSKLIAQETRKAVNALNIAHELSATSSVLTVSVGMAYIQPKATDEEDSYIKAVNFALSVAKDTGGGRAMLYTMADGRLTDCDGPHEEGQLLLEL